MLEASPYLLQNESQYLLITLGELLLSSFPLAKFIINCRVRFYLRRHSTFGQSIRNKVQSLFMVLVVVFEKSLINSDLQFLLRIVIISQKEMKSRNWTPQEDQALIKVMAKLQKENLKATWNQIAELVMNESSLYLKNGKQCRERWANQLNPAIKKDEEWTQRENQTLFSLQGKWGNKWSLIADRIPGRTDNCVKNHFYAIMRKGFKMVNLYIQKIKRKYKLVKIFEQKLLFKVLAMCEQKFTDKYHYNELARGLALQIKDKLVETAIRGNQAADQDCEIKQLVYSLTSEFARNCKKKKAKTISRLSGSGTISEKEEKRLKQVEYFSSVVKSQPRLSLSENCNDDSEMLRFKERMFSKCCQDKLLYSPKNIFKNQQPKVQQIWNQKAQQAEHKKQPGRVNQNNKQLPKAEIIQDHNQLKVEVEKAETYHPAAGVNHVLNAHCLPCPWHMWGMNYFQPVSFSFANHVADPKHWVSNMFAFAGNSTSTLSSYPADLDRQLLEQTNKNAVNRAQSNEGPIEHI